MGTSGIQEKVVVITGASSGLGESTAKLLARHGAKVVLGARRKDRLDAVVSEISAAGGKAIRFAVDVTKRVEVEALPGSDFERKRHPRRLGRTLRLRESVDAGC
jgi:NADP-dependent 3-hydroxy acid dehydrogenase YdfG